MSDTRGMGRLLAVLVAPSSRITDPDARLGARLFSTLMLAHVVLVSITIGAISTYWTHATGGSIWDDEDTVVVLAAVAIICVCYGLVRAGFYRTGVAIYIANAAILPVTAPFVPDPDAEIAILATAMIPVLLTAMVYSWRWVLGVLLAIVAAATVQLLVTDLPIQRRLTGVGILVTVAVTGGLLLLFQRHLAAMERMRMERLLVGEESLRRSREQEPAAVRDGDGRDLHRRHGGDGCRGQLGGVSPARILA